MLIVNHLTKAFKDDSKFGRVMAVDDVSFSVEDGQFFTLLGPSGCGKTTTLRCIAGLEHPDGGEIVVDETVLYSGERGLSVAANHRNLGMVFQSYAIWPHMNVFDNVAFPLRVGTRRRTPKAVLRERVERSLTVVGLDHLAGRFATKLSGGQQQRLALARALVIEPNLLLLDEPLSNLDAKLRESLRFELKRLQREQGITTVYVTHDQSEALSMSNAIAVMKDGRISQIGDPFSVYLKPENAFVADFVGSTNFLDAVMGQQGPDGWSVRASIAELTVAENVGVTPGAPCIVSIRPEHVKIVRDGDPDSGNVVTGEVLTRLFTGEGMDYEVQLPEAKLRVRTPVSVRLSSGSSVRLRLPAAACTALARADASARADLVASASLS